MNIKAVKIIAVMLIWAACAPATYTLLKRDWVRQRHSMFDFKKIYRLPWTARGRSDALYFSALGPIGLSLAVGITMGNALPEGDPNVRAEW